MLRIILLLFWLQDLQLRSLAWWGWSRILRAFAICVYIRFDPGPHWWLVETANALLFASYALTWCGAREFAGRNPLLVPLLTAAGLWFIAQAGFLAFGTVTAHSLTSAALVTAFLWLAASELTRGSLRGLRLRWPAVLILFGYGAIFLVEARSIHWVSSYHLFYGATLLSRWALLGDICAIFVLFGMAKEHAECSARRKMALSIGSVS